MVGTICSVGGGERSLTKRFCDSLLFLVASAGGALVVAGLLLIISSIASGPKDWVAVPALICIAVAAAAWEVGLMKVRLPTLTRQVQPGWWGTLDSRLVSLGWGVQLGTGVATRINSAGYYVLVAAVVVLGTESAASVYLIYGMVRGLQPFAAVSIDALGGTGSEITEHVVRYRRNFEVAVAMLSLTFATTLIL